MQPTSLLCSTILAAFFTILCCSQSSGKRCDVPWLREMYVKSCGLKKRESISIGDENYSELTDIYAEDEYFNDRDLQNPLFKEYHDLLNDIHVADGTGDFPEQRNAELIRRKRSDSIAKLAKKCCGPNNEIKCTEEDFRGAC